MDAPIFFENQTDFDGPVALYHDPIFEVILYSSLTFAGMLMDTLIIFTILRHTELRTPRYILIANWALADFVFLLFENSKFELVSLSWGSFIFALIKVHLMSHTAVFASILMIFLDFIYTKFRESNVFNILGIFWVTTGAILLSTTFLSIKHNIPVDFYSSVCLFFALIVIFVVKTTVALWKDKQSLSSKVVSLMTFIYIVCWLPIFIIDFHEIVVPHYVVQHEFLIGFVAIGYVNQMFVFGVLLFLDKELRKCVGSVLTCKPKGEDKVESV